MMNNVAVRVIEKNWVPLSNMLSMPCDENEYRSRLELLDYLIDEVGDNKNHKLASFLNTVSLLIEKYEDNFCDLPKSSPQEVLEYLMEERQLTQKQLPEIGSQGVVSEILNGKRKLNARQIQALSKRFSVSPQLFFG
jgi:HTH-type transcriptional regulator / antitoxin HigA